MAYLEKLGMCAPFSSGISTKRIVPKAMDFVTSGLQKKIKQKTNCCYYAEIYHPDRLELTGNF